MNDNENLAAGQTLTATALSQEHIHIDATAIKQIGALSLAANAVQEVAGTAQLVIPEGHRHIDLTGLIEKASPAPYRKQGTVQLSDIASFNIFVADQGSPENVYVYADPDSHTLTAVLNDQVKSGGLAGWRDFRAVYKAELSREFAGWIKNNKQAQDQEAFAIFIEDNIADVVEPSGETLLAVALTLQTKTEVAFNSGRRLDNGQVQLTFTESIDARAGANGSIEIPNRFAIGVRLFKNGEGYKVNARLKYRLGGGKVKFWYELERPENAIEEAFQAYINLAREAGFTVLIGKP